MAYIDNPYANSLRQAQAMPAVQQALGGYEGGMDGLMRLFQQQYSRPQQQTNIYNPQVETQQTKQRMPPIPTPDQLRNQTRFRDNEPSAPAPFSIAQRRVAPQLPPVAMTQDIFSPSSFTGYP